MKKVIAFLFLSGFLTQCSTNDDNLNKEEEEQKEKTEDLTISLNIEGNLINEFQERTLYISNEDGVIEGQTPLLNNKKNVLTLSREPEAQYDLIVHDKTVSNGQTRHTLNIYQNIQSSEYTIDANYRSPGSLPILNLNLVNTGNLKQIGITGGGSSTAGNTGGGYFNFEGTFLTKPGNYYTSFKKEGESFARYFWVENIEEDLNLTLDYEELPSAKLVQTQLPEHEAASFFIGAHTLKYPGVRHILSYGSTQGNPTYETYIPEESIFDFVSINATLYNGNTSYTFFAVSESLPSTIKLPSFDLNINSFTPHNVDFTTTGDYDFSIATLVFPQEQSDFTVIVNVYSEHDSQISFSIDKLIDSIFEEVPSLDSSDLIPSSIKLSSQNYRNSYAEAIKGVIENRTVEISPGNSSETLIRRNN